MDLIDIGRILKEEREKKGYSVEDVYKGTKISIMNIEAIENGDFELLPHPIYTRSFIKAYAQFLGLDPKEFLESYDSILTPHKLKKPLQKELPVRVSRFWIWLLIGVFLLFIVISVLFFKIHRSNLYDISSIDVTNKTNVVIGNKTDFRENGVVEPETKSEEINKTEEIVSVNNSTPNATDVEIPSVNSTIVEQKNMTYKNSSFPLTVKGLNKMHVVKIVAKERCWLRGKYDGNHTKEALLSKGDSILFEFKDGLELKVGNIGGIEVLFDGEKQDLKGKKGQVKTLRFP